MLTPTKDHARRQVRRRRGAMHSLEMLIAVPVLLAVIGAASQYTMMFLAQQRLQSAIDVTARSAGADLSAAMFLTDAQSAVESKLRAALEDVPWADEMQIELVDVESDASLVRITARVPAKTVAPDILAMIGFGLKNREVAASAVIPLD